MSKQKIIITIEDDIEPELAVRMVEQVIEGGSVPNDRKFLTVFNYYTDLLTLNQQREDRVPDHIDAMFQERYGYHFNRD